VPKKIRGKGRGGWLSQGAHRGRTVQVRELPAGHRAGPGGFRRLLAQGSERQAPGLRSIPEESTRAAALKRGDIDVTYLLNGPIAADVKRTAGLTLTAMRTNGVLWVEFPEQWTQGSPWADRRVRAAASHAIDRQAINEAESLGYSAPTGNIVPRHQEFALAIDPLPYDPKRARALLAEAGYPNGFEAGELTPFPPYTGMGEAIVNYFAAVGIKTHLRTMERRVAPLGVARQEDARRFRRRHRVGGATRPLGSKPSRRARAA